MGMMGKFRETDFARAERLQRELDKITERCVELAEPEELPFDGTTDGAISLIETRVINLTSDVRRLQGSAFNARGEGWSEAIRHVRFIFQTAYDESGLVTRGYYRALLDMLDNDLANPYED